jgi:hypothetical protein
MRDGSWVVSIKKIENGLLRKIINQAKFHTLFFVNIFTYYLCLGSAAMLSWRSIKLVMCSARLSARSTPKTLIKRQIMHLRADCTRQDGFLSPRPMDRETVEVMDVDIENLRALMTMSLEILVTNREHEAAAHLRQALDALPHDKAAGRLMAVQSFYA